MLKNGVVDRLMCRVACRCTVHDVSRQWNPDHNYSLEGTPHPEQSAPWRVNIGSSHQKRTSVFHASSFSDLASGQRVNRCMTERGTPSRTAARLKLIVQKSFVDLCYVCGRHHSLPPLHCSPAPGVRRPSRRHVALEAAG